MKSMENVNIALFLRMPLTNHSVQIQFSVNKRKRISRKNHDLDENCVDKLQPLLKILKNRDEEKASARLHSFNGTSKRTKSCPNM